MGPAIEEGVSQGPDSFVVDYVGDVRWVIGWEGDI
jgi:hypothetical protein